MFGASETPYDLRFQALGIPVRVHPLFWLVAAMLGWRQENIPIVAIWVSCVFLAVLVHEYGHGLMAKAYGASPSILLQGFGGLCSYPQDRQTPRQRLAVLLWGPGAGFVLCLVVMGVFSVLCGITVNEHVAFVKDELCGYFGFLEKFDAMRPDRAAWNSLVTKLIPERTRVGGAAAAAQTIPVRLAFYMILVEINILWGLINLLPIWPLDGGQVTQTLLTQANPFNGRRWTHIVSLLVAALAAIYVYSQSQSLFTTLFFGYFAVINYQMLDAIHRAQSYGIYDDERWR